MPVRKDCGSQSGADRYDQNHSFLPLPGAEGHLSDAGCVGIVDYPDNGEESTKGNSLVKEAYPLMEASGLRFIGNLEPKEFFAGKADVLVTDGFSGNVMLKTSEAVSSFLIDLLRTQIRAGMASSLGGMLARPAFRRVRAVLDPAEYGAGPLLGVDGLVFVGHGRSDVRALVNALRVARQAVASGLLPAMRQAIQAHLTPQTGEGMP